MKKRIAQVTSSKIKYLQDKVENLENDLIFWKKESKWFSDQAMKHLKDSQEKPSFYYFIGCLAGFICGMMVGTFWK